MSNNSSNRKEEGDGDKRRDLVNRILSGEERAIARLISNIENQLPGIDEVLEELYPYTGNAYIIGVTGAVGTGKSTLINSLIQYYKSQGLSLGIVCIDPSSPITGGALLGDRLRFSLGSDKNVFVRSMATRGCKGGVSKSLRDVIRVLDASGKDVIIIETIGVSQVDIDIVNYVDTLLLILMPNMGDDIQMMKAGLLEVADIIVINKADLSNSEDLMLAINENLNLKGGWMVPVVKTVATKNLGIYELIKKIDEHKNYLINTREFDARRKNRIKEEVLEEVINRLRDNIVASIDKEYEEIIQRVLRREITPSIAAKLLVKTLINK
ncbi:MAG: methylmalonyl Co-A mutase-associated GTPase MeaB [Nitrososphaerota archaeon]|nr:methylmalonyl Co-A mutase-associated GTPase MeaB [Nitrososphaerota archaeon]